MSSTLLVTGATGFLGREVVRAALAAGYRVRALVRRESSTLGELGIEQVRGDVENPADCAAACEGISHVIHAAGFVSRDQEDAGKLYAVHVDGTRNMLEAAQNADVVRMCVVSTSGTIGVSKEEGEPATEAADYPMDVVSQWPYYLSKIYQERLCLEFAQKHSLEVVIANPSLLLGPGDLRRSSTKDVELVVRGLLPMMAPGGGVAFVDVRDAAQGCLRVLERGVSGERYLLNGANMPLKDFLGRVARLASVPAPREVPFEAPMRFAARLTESLFRRVNRESPLSEASLQMAACTWYVSADKAKNDLEWSHREPHDTLADTVHDIMQRYNLGRFKDREESTR